MSETRHEQINIFLREGGHCGEELREERLELGYLLSKVEADVCGDLVIAGAACVWGVCVCVCVCVYTRCWWVGVEQERCVCVCVLCVKIEM